jgi:hypothetical protein
MITGFNSEVHFNEIVYHVQTEDRGIKAGRIDTIIYKSGGAIVHRKQIFYKDILGCELFEQAVRELMEEIHDRTINEIRKGLWTVGVQCIPDRSFKEVVDKYLLSPADI